MEFIEVKSGVYVNLNQITYIETSILGKNVLHFSSGETMDIGSSIGKIKAIVDFD